MSQTFVWLFLMQPSFAAAADLKPKSALFGQIQCPRQSRQKADFSTEFCLPPTPNPPTAAAKVEQNLPKLKKCSTADSKSASRGPESRTKIPKIEKCSTADSKSASRTSQSRTKYLKIEKIFYRRLQIRLARPRK